MASILDAAEEVLANSAYEGLNTNAVALQAGVNISTLYRYFSDKQVIVEHLLERYNEKNIHQIQKVLAKHHDKDERVGLIVDAQIKQLLQSPGMIALRDALVSVPALEPLRRHSEQHLIALVLSQIPQNVAGPKVSGKKQKAVMQVLVELFNFSIQMVVKAPPAMRKALKGEATLLINSYLSHYR